MQQWIPRTQTLEPRIWGQVGLRQGLYIGLGIFAGILLLIALAPFGLGPRVAGALTALAAGVVAGFMRIKGLSPERYLFHRVRFALRRQGLGIWQAPDALPPRVEVDAERLVKDRKARPKTAAAGVARPTRRVSPPRAAATARWTECTVEASPFGLGFYLAALGAMGVAIVYLAGRPTF